MFRVGFGTFPLRIFIKYDGSIAPSNVRDTSTFEYSRPSDRRWVRIGDRDPTQISQIVQSLTNTGDYRVLHASTVPNPLPSLVDVQAVFCAPPYNLTSRESEILFLQVNAPRATHDELAQRACLTRYSVKTYFNRIYRKLGVVKNSTNTDQATGREGMLALVAQHFPSAPLQVQMREIGSN